MNPHHLPVDAQEPAPPPQDGVVKPSALESGAQEPTQPVAFAPDAAASEPSRALPGTLTAARDAAAFVANIFAETKSEQPQPIIEASHAKPAQEEITSKDTAVQGQTEAPEQPMLGQNILVLGLGASGLAMARWCVRAGAANVTVADTRNAPPQLTTLQQELPLVRFVAGAFDAALVEGQNLHAVYRSPGLSPQAFAPVSSAAQLVGISVGSELSLFAMALQALRTRRGYAPTLLAITGTNGKTTVTSLTGALVALAGKSVAVAGNIGPSLLDTLAAHLDANTLPEVWVLELSSFQLDGVNGFEPSAATVLNITQDHLDWHGSLSAAGPSQGANTPLGLTATAPSLPAQAGTDGRAVASGIGLSSAAHEVANVGAAMQAYAQAKSRIFGAAGMMVLNRDDALVMAMLPQPQRVKLQRPQERPHITFGTDMPRRPGDFGIEEVNGMVWLVRALEADETRRKKKDEAQELHFQRLMPADALRIRGRHNASNALAALALCAAAGCALAPILFGLREYRGEPHRVESIGILNGVEFFDDSKGTNVGATVAALQGLGVDRKLVVILGGEGKGQDFSPLAAPIARYARAVVLIGRDAAVIRQAIGSVDIPMVDAESMATAVVQANQRAHAGDAVLMSPACASFDMFDNYEHRARVYGAAVKDLALKSGVDMEGFG